MKSENTKVGNSLKDRRLCGELKDFVLVTTRAKRFCLKKGKSTVICNKKTILVNA